MVKAAAKRAGVNPAVSVHWLRHAHASHAIDNGAPITLVSATLGHADLKTTSVLCSRSARRELRAVSQDAMIGLPQLDEETSYSFSRLSRNSLKKASICRTAATTGSSSGFAPALVASEPFSVAMTSDSIV